MPGMPGCYDRLVPTRRRWPWILALAIAVVAGGVIGLVVAIRVRTGHWEVDVDDVVSIVSSSKAPAPSKVIYLERAQVTVTPGDDDAAHGVSSVAGALHPQGPVTMPGWK